ncbi:MAG: MFS transporter [Gammaproteobacteria bacterium]|nr:MFS transporter [Gammaproteobacteria bacterium]
MAIGPAVQLTSGKRGALAPLREPVFARIWGASILANFGQLILGVGVAWEMTRLTSSASMVALVQTAMMLPLMLVALPAGAFADMFDRRRLAMLGLGMAAFFGSVLSALAFFQLTSPWILLLACSLIGTGVAIYNPAWQSSIGEQVKSQDLPAAIALGTISYNVARSFGPAIGGLIVLAAGAQAAFAVNALAYLPLILAFFLWKRGKVVSRLPPERITRAIISGARFAFHSHPIRTVLARAFIFGLAGATASALAPLIARDLLGGDASIYGILLGASGVGAVTGALMINIFRERFSAERATAMLAILGGLALVAIGFSRSLPLTCLGLYFTGGTGMLTIALFNISVQISVPRWVTARALSLYSSSLTGGIAFGAWFWGNIANSWSVETAIIASGLFMLATPLFALFLPLPDVTQAGSEPVPIVNEPEVALAINMRSGPLVIEIEYRIDPKDARAYYNAMLDIQRTRLRNGGFNWSITRDIGDPTLWIERYHLPTWADYLRMRDRFTQADLDAQAAVDMFIMPGEPKRIRRGLERPFGSVRWKVDTPDPHADGVVYTGP